VNAVDYPPWLQKTQVNGAVAQWFDVFVRSIRRPALAALDGHAARAQTNSDHEQINSRV
jgi:hypothetical protein